MGGREGFAAHKLLGWIEILIPYIIITSVFIYKSGQTPGMRAYEIKVVDIGNGKVPGLGITLLRQTLAVFSFLFLGWILMFFRKDHRMPHELLTNTALIFSPSQK